MKSCGILFAVDFLGRSRMKKIWWITTNVIEKIWWNNFWHLCWDINFVIDGTKWDFFRAKDDCRLPMLRRDAALAMETIIFKLCCQPNQR